MNRQYTECKEWKTKYQQKSNTGKSKLQRTYPASETLWGLTDPPVGAGANSHNVRVDGTRDTVLHLGIQLG